MESQKITSVMHMQQVHTPAIIQKAEEEQVHTPAIQRGACNVTAMRMLG